MSLILKNVSKKFVGKQAVDNISSSLEKPGVFGLLGTNGAGKPTTIRILLGIIKKDSGEITWKGKEVDRKHVRFGYLPEERGVYPKTKIFDQLMYFAELKGMNKVDAIKSINKWAKELKVEEYMQMPAEKLSKGIFPIINNVIGLEKHNLWGRQFTIANALAAIWLIIAGVFMLRYFVKYQEMRRIFQKYSTEANEQCQSVLSRITQEKKIKKKIAVYQNPGITIPCAEGVFRQQNGKLGLHSGGR